MTRFIPKGCVPPAALTLALAFFASTLLSPCSPLLAGPLSEAAAAAEAKSKTGDALGAYDTMRQALADFSSTLPLMIGKGLFTETVPTAYGIYTPRKNATFRPGEPLITYLELVGLTWKPAEETGKQQTSFSVDFELTDSKGVVLATQKTFGNFGFTGLYRNQEVFTHLTLDLSGAAPGDYILRYIVTDTAGARSARLEQPFTIALQ